MCLGQRGRPGQDILGLGIQAGAAPAEGLFHGVQVPARGEPGGLEGVAEKVLDAAGPDLLPLAGLALHQVGVIPLADRVAVIAVPGAG